MGKSRHAEAQIIAVLKQVEAGRTVDDVDKTMLQDVLSRKW